MPNVVAGTDRQTCNIKMPSARFMLSRLIYSAQSSVNTNRLYKMKTRHGRAVNYGGHHWWIFGGLSNIIGRIVGEIIFYL